MCVADVVMTTQTTAGIAAVVLQTTCLFESITRTTRSMQDE